MNKKNTILSFLAGAAMLAGAPSAFAAGEGWFVAGRAGSGSVDENVLDDSDTALGISGGYRWGWLGLEVGYLDFGSWSRDFQGFLEDDTPITARSVAALQGFTVGVNARAPLSPKWSLTGRAGVFDWDSDAFTDVQTLARIDLGESGTDWYAGVGVAYSVTDNFDLGIAYDRYRANGDTFDLTTDAFSATAEFRF